MWGCWTGDCQRKVCWTGEFWERRAVGQVSVGDVAVLDR